MTGLSRAPTAQHFSSSLWNVNSDEKFPAKNRIMKNYLWKEAFSECSVELAGAAKLQNQLAPAAVASQLAPAILVGMSIWTWTYNVTSSKAESAIFLIITFQTMFSWVVTTIDMIGCRGDLIEGTRVSTVVNTTLLIRVMSRLKGGIGSVDLPSTLSRRFTVYSTCPKILWFKNFRK